MKTYKAIRLGIIRRRRPDAQAEGLSPAPNSYRGYVVVLHNDDGQLWFDVPALRATGVAPTWAELQQLAVGAINFALRQKREVAP